MQSKKKYFFNKIYNSFFIFINLLAIFLMMPSMFLSNFINRKKTISPENSVDLTFLLLIFHMLLLTAFIIFIASKHSFLVGTILVLSSLFIPLLFIYSFVCIHLKSKSVFYRNSIIELGRRMPIGSTLYFKSNKLFLNNSSVHTELKILEFESDDFIISNCNILSNIANSVERFDHHIEIYSYLLVKNLKIKL